MLAKTFKSRDYFLKAIILGSVKAGIVPDYRKHTNKFACRGKQMPAAVLARAPTSDVVVDWERDNDLFRVYADVYTLDDGSQDVVVLDIHLLDETLQPEAVINTSMFTGEEWSSINETIVDEWRRQGIAP
jgi:hypothetical protein